MNYNFYLRRSNTSFSSSSWDYYYLFKRFVVVPSSLSFLLLVSVFFVAVGKGVQVLVVEQAVVAVAPGEGLKGRRKSQIGKGIFCWIQGAAKVPRRVFLCHIYPDLGPSDLYLVAFDFPYNFACITC
jgi:hypothetical protein